MAQDRGRAGSSYAPLELTIVVAVIAALIGLAGIGSTKIGVTASTVARRGNVRTVQIAEAGYRAQRGEDAPDVETLVREGFLREAPAGIALQGGEVVVVDPTSSTTSTTLLPALPVTVPALPPVTLP